MLRHLLRQCRSAKDAARIRRAWMRWHAEMNNTNKQDRNEQFYRDSRSNSGAGSGYSNDSHGSSWSQEFFTSFSGHQNSWQGDYETFWSYDSTSGKSWEQTQREQAGNAHPKFNRQQQTASVQYLNSEVRSSLVLLGLEATVLPNAAGLKSAVRKCAMEHHPDRHGCNSEATAAAEQRFKEIQAAFELLQTLVVP